MLSVSQADAGFADAEFAAHIAAEVSSEAGRPVDVTIQLVERDLGGGCIARSQDGRIVYDNTYPKRLERARKDLRARIVKELVQSNG
jgi:vacuolar-type H+-ATPase subunit E/Vma4